ncbi:MAG: hypothetical protein ACO1OB_10955 [Archangium sp.]
MARLDQAGSRFSKKTISNSVTYRAARFIPAHGFGEPADGETLDELVARSLGATREDGIIGEHGCDEVLRPLHELALRGPFVTIHR